MKRCRLFSFGTTIGAPAPRDIEARMKDFMFTGEHTESVDSLTFKRIKGSPPIADYLLGAREFIAELKTLTADPAPAVGRKLRDGLDDAGVFVFGQIGVNRVLEGIPTGEELRRKLRDTTGRRIRLNLKKANDQIASTKELFNLPRSSGVVIMLNGAVPLMGATTIASTLRDALEPRGENLHHIDCVMVFIEAHTIRLPTGEPGYPILMVSDAERPMATGRLQYLGSMIDHWAEWNNREIHLIDHAGRWEALYDIGMPPIIKLD